MKENIALASETNEKMHIITPIRDYYGPILDLRADPGKFNFWKNWGHHNFFGDFVTFTINFLLMKVLEFLYRSKTHPPWKGFCSRQRHQPMYSCHWVKEYPWCRRLNQQEYGPTPWYKVRFGIILFKQRAQRESMDELRMGLCTHGLLRRDWGRCWNQSNLCGFCH